MAFYSEENNTLEGTGIELTEEELAIFPFKVLERLTNQYPVYRTVVLAIFTPCKGTFLGEEFEIEDEFEIYFEHEEFKIIAEEFKTIVSGPLDGVPVHVNNRYFGHLVEIRLKVGA